MCGINGIINGDSSFLNKMNVALSHRGPDGQGVFNNKENTVSLGHLRLSVIDLTDAGHQPMHYSKDQGASSSQFSSEKTDSRFSITYNGEIYNYLEIRKELQELDYLFTTNSDTEVILAAYSEWAEECVHHFNGMWSFCIYDQQDQTIFCSRDRFGQKPFYYHHKKNRFVFSSEIKGLVAHSSLEINTAENISRESVQLYFSLGFIPAPHTIYKNVFKLEAGHNLQMNLSSGKVVTKKYYNLPVCKPNNNKQSLIKQGRELLLSATRLRMRSDVPIGAFLSGGLDSSSIVAEMTNHTDKEKLHTFSIGFDGKYDESNYINIVKDSLQTKHHHEYFTESDFSKQLNDHAQTYDEPYASPSSFPTLSVSKLAREHVTVSLSGDGGDEVFGGYNSHTIGRKLDLLKRTPAFIFKILLKIPHQKLQLALSIVLDDPALFRYTANKRSGYTPDIFKKWTQEKSQIAWELSSNSISEMTRIFDMLFFTLPDDFLMKVDRASMKHSLEVRSPFLDYRFMEFSQTIPTKWKVSLGKKQKVLMQSIITGMVPNKIIHRKKQGFTPPVEVWIDRNKYAKDILSGQQLLSQFDPALDSFYKKILKQQNKTSQTYKIRLLTFYLWYKKWIV